MIFASPPRMPVWRRKNKNESLTTRHVVQAHAHTAVTVMTRSRACLLVCLPAGCRLGCPALKFRLAERCENADAAETKDDTLISLIRRHE